MIYKKGVTWNESETYRDTWTLRQVRRMTTQGTFNRGASYHTNTGFSADGEFMVFVSQRGSRGLLLRGHVSTGDLTPLIEPTAEADLRVCLAPRSGWAVYNTGRKLKAVHMQTLEERLITADYGPGWDGGIITIDAAETNVVMSVAPHVDDPKSMGLFRRTYPEALMKRRLIQIPLAGGQPKPVYEETGCRGGHCQYSPVDNDVLLIDRDLPPRFWGGSDGVTNRIWLLRLATGKLTELPPRDLCPFQVHSTWTWDGQNIIYHGWSLKGGYYIGVADQQGQTVQEYDFYRREHYGHVSAAAGRPAIILDGNLTTDLLLWLYYDAAQPRLEVIARHGTDWTSLPHQRTHPHPQSDPTGRWISFTAAQRGRSDVFVVKV